MGNKRKQKRIAVTESSNAFRYIHSCPFYCFVLTFALIVIISMAMVRKLYSYSYIQLEMVLLNYMNVSKRLLWLPAILFITYTYIYICIIPGTEAHLAKLPYQPSFVNGYVDTMWPFNRLQLGRQHINVMCSWVINLLKINNLCSQQNACARRKIPIQPNGAHII